MTDQKTKGRLVAGAVVFLLVVVPIISYFFLRRGFEYRKESLTQLEAKEISHQLATSLHDYALHTGNAQLIHIPGSELEKEVAILEAIDEQIVDRDRFDILSFSEDPLPTSEKKITYVPEAKGIDADYSFILIDTANVIRGTYSYHDDLDKELIRHLAVVIPVPKRKTIKLQRDSM